MDRTTVDETEQRLGAIHDGGLEDFVTFVIEGQLFGVPVLNVQDILAPENIASIPLAPAEVCGSINLRGRIVTVIDVRVRLGLPSRQDNGHNMGVTVEYNSELYTLLVDEVGEVLSLNSEAVEKVPGTLDPMWRELACGVYQLEDRLMVILNVERTLQLTN